MLDLITTKKIESNRFFCDFAALEAETPAKLIRPTQSEQISEPVSHPHLQPVPLMREVVSKWVTTSIFASLTTEEHEDRLGSAEQDQPPSLVCIENCDQSTISSSHSACSVFTGAIFVQGQDH